jgi:formylglycine-generating enzyme required for sulfatase activity
MSTVFISYSQNDKEIAARVRASLEASGIKVTIDSESMAAGGNIREFIDQAIRNTEVTLSIVSRNSLSSDWVALESVESFAAEKFLEGKKFIACYIDEEAFRDGFQIEAVDALDQQIDELDRLIQKSKERKLSADHLETKRRRKLDLRNNLDKVLKRYQDSLTLDIREPKYETSLQRIIEVIKDLPAKNSTQSGGGSSPTASVHQIVAQGARSVAAEIISAPVITGNVSGGIHYHTHIVDEKRADAASFRDKEIAYLNDLRDEELKALTTYTQLGGQVSERPIIKAVFEHKPGEKFDIGKRFSKPVETRRFEDAVGEILKLKHAVVLGEPGAGKTTTLWKLAGDLIPKALASPAERLPILIRLGKWTDETMPVMTFLSGQLGVLGDELERLLAENRAILLLDGLNELPAGQRKAKTVEIRELIKKWPSVTTIISCRLLDYDQNELDYDRVEIVPLDPVRIKQFVCGYLGQKNGEKLFWQLAGKEAQETYGRFKQEFTGKIPEMDKVFWCDRELTKGITWGWFEYDNLYWERWIRDREHPSSLMVLAKNPFMLMMLYIVYDAEKGALPENRGQLFDDFAETLFKREKVTAEDLPQLRTGIARVAFEMQTRRTSQEEGDALTVLPRSEVAKLLDERLIGIATRASILSPGEEIRFTHQLLQEYFAARYMDTEIKAGRLQASSLWPAEKWWERNNWEEATVLLAGLYSDDCTKIIDWIADANPEVAVACIKRSGSVCPPGTLEDLKRRWLPRLTDLKRDPDPRARAAVGRALGMTGLDDRPGVGTKVDANGIVLPDIEWVEIPAGEFVYSDPADNRLKLGRFGISRYPVTYKQFQVFIEDPEGIRQERWFAGLTDDKNEQLTSEQRFQFDNNPRENVSWYQAVAFCRWLSWRLGGVYALDWITLWRVRLPAEYEWLRAARGLDGRIYPYGKDFDPAKCNTRDTGIGQPSAIGIFPNGSSPDGSLDMSGNVMEWCQTTYHIFDEEQDMGANRVLKGSDWNSDEINCRLQVRRSNKPGFRSRYVGFRLVKNLF